MVSLNDFLFQSCIWGERVISAFASRERCQIIHMVLLKKKSRKWILFTQPVAHLYSVCIGRWRNRGNVTSETLGNLKECLISPYSHPQFKPSEWVLSTIPGGVSCAGEHRGWCLCSVLNISHLKIFKGESLIIVSLEARALRGSNGDPWKVTDLVLNLKHLAQEARAVTKW